MQLPSLFTDSIVSPEQSGSGIPLLVGRWLLLARLVWWVTTLLVVVLFVVAFPGTLDALASLNPTWRLLVGIARFLGMVFLSLFMYLFPDGRFVPAWMRFIALGGLLIQVPDALFPGSPLSFSHLPRLLIFALFLSLLIFPVMVQVYRYRRLSNIVQRQQTKWVIFGLLVAIVGFLSLLLLTALVLPTGQNNAIGQLIVVSAYYLFLLLIPLAIGFAVLRYHLWDIDLIINRTLVYGILTACVIGIYVLVVGYLGTLFHTGSSFLISLLATGLVAVLFQPLKGWLQRGVNRLLYGQRDEPYQVISRLGQRLEATLAPDAVLTVIVETVAQALKLPYAAIVLKQEQTSSLATSYGTAVEPVVRLPLLYQSEEVGELLLAPRSRGEAFTPADRRLLEDLARQVGIAAHAVRLTADLQQARERLVTAREEERRRLRRDLHDGLGPQLSSQTLLLTSAQMLLRQNPDEAEAILASAIAQSQQAISDIRRLVYALRPPALDDLGLLAAIQEQLAQNRASGIVFSFEADEPLPPLPAAVEVACYRIVQEAITNVVRHALAHHCIIRLKCAEQLTIEVIDDGPGPPPAYRNGVGLSSMRERAEELGGSWLIEPAPGGGTRVQVCLPYR